MSHNSLIPLINIAPLQGYRMHQLIPMEELGRLVAVPDADIVAEWRLFAGGACRVTKRAVLQRRAGQWLNPQDACVVFDGADYAGDWNDAESPPYVESHFISEAEPVFSTVYPPSFYTVYDSAGKKPFYSDGALKFANPYVINQIKELKIWCETYPAVEIDRERGVTTSVVMINPYPLPSVVSCQLHGTETSFKQRIMPESAVRIDLGKKLPADVSRWSDVFMASGRNRVILFFISHSAGADRQVNTVEHSEVYRGARTGRLLFDRLEDVWRRLRRGKTSARQRDVTRKIPT